MTITATARRHVVRALREALGVRDGHAAFIVDWFVNVERLEAATVKDLRGVRALVVGADGFCPRADLYVDDGRGFEPIGVEIELQEGDVARWLRLPIEEAYAIAAEIHQNRGQGMIDADRALEAERAAWAAEAEAAAIAANDDDEFDGLPVPALEPRDWIWTDGVVLSADVAPSGDHVLATVEIGVGGAEPETMAMFPLFAGASDLLAYARGRVGTPSRLCVGRVGAFDDTPPAGFDRSMRTLDMIVEREARLPLRLAA